MNTVSGVLPDGTYDRNTAQELCCRSDAAGISTSGVPVQQTLILSDPTTTCTSLFAPGAVFRDTEDSNNADAVSGSCPSSLKITDGLSFKFCTPVWSCACCLWSRGHPLCSLRRFVRMRLRPLAAVPSGYIHQRRVYGVTLPRR